MIEHGMTDIDYVVDHLAIFVNVVCFWCCTKLIITNECIYEKYLRINAVIFWNKISK